MNANMEIEVFRAGDYGPKGIYSPDDLQRIASDYDPARHEVGWPPCDAWAMCWSLA
jgi:hypothetical protein